MHEPRLQYELQRDELSYWNYHSDESGLQTVHGAVAVAFQCGTTLNVVLEGRSTVSTLSAFDSST